MNDDLARFPTPLEAFGQRRPQHTAAAFDTPSEVPVPPTQQRFREEKQRQSPRHTLEHHKRVQRQPFVNESQTSSQKQFSYQSQKQYPLPDQTSQNQYYSQSQPSASSTSRERVPSGGRKQQYDQRHTQNQPNRFAPQHTPTKASTQQQIPINQQSIQRPSNHQQLIPPQQHLQHLQQYPQEQYQQAPYMPQQISQQHPQQTLQQIPTQTSPTNTAQQAQTSVAQHYSPRVPSQPEMQTVDQQMQQFRIQAPYQQQYQSPQNTPPKKMTQSNQNTPTSQPGSHKVARRPVAPLPVHPGRLPSSESRPTTPNTPGTPATPQVAPDLRSLFDGVDRHKRGYLTEHELSKALVNDDYTLFDAHTVRLMMKMFDRDDDGALYFAEFGQLWKYLHDWRQVFGRFDTSKNDSISLDEFKRALAAFGYNLTESTQLFMFNAGSKLNRQGQREMSFDMFVQSCISIKSITDTFKKYDTDRDGYVTMSFEDFLIETTKLH